MFSVEVMKAQIHNICKLVNLFYCSLLLNEMMPPKLAILFQNFFIHHMFGLHQPGIFLSMVFNLCQIAARKWDKSPSHFYRKGGEPSPDSRTGKDRKTAPNGQNDLKFYMQGAFARLQSHKKVTVSFGTIFKVRITPNDTVTFLCECILDFGQVEVTQHLWRSNQYVSLLAPSECQTCILNTKMRLSSRFDLI